MKVDPPVAQAEPISRRATSREGSATTIEPGSSAYYSLREASGGMGLVRLQRPGPQVYVRAMYRTIDGRWFGVSVADLGEKNPFGADLPSHFELDQAEAWDLLRAGGIDLPESATTECSPPTGITTAAASEGMKEYWMGQKEACDKCRISESTMSKAIKNGFVKQRDAEHPSKSHRKEVEFLGAYSFFNRKNQP